MYIVGRQTNSDSYLPLKKDVVQNETLRCCDVSASVTPRFVPQRQAGKLSPSPCKEEEHEKEEEEEDGATND